MVFKLLMKLRILSVLVRSMLQRDVCCGLNLPCSHKWNSRHNYLHILDFLRVTCLRYSTQLRWSGLCRYHKKVSNIIDDVLEWKPNLAALTGNSAEKVVINETLQNETAASESFSEDLVEPDTQTADGLLDDVIEDSSLQEETGSPGEAEDPVKGSKEHDVEL